MRSRQILILALVGAFWSSTSFGVVPPIAACHAEEANREIAKQNLDRCVAQLEKLNASNTQTDTIICLSELRALNARVQDLRRCYQGNL